MKTNSLFLILFLPIFSSCLLFPVENIQTINNNSPKISSNSIANEQIIQATINQMNNEKVIKDFESIYAGGDTFFSFKKIEDETGKEKCLIIVYKEIQTNFPSDEEIKNLAKKYADKMDDYIPHTSYDGIELNVTRKFKEIDYQYTSSKIYTIMY